MSISLHKTPGRVTTAAPPGHRAQLAAVVALIALGGVLAFTVYAVMTAAGDLVLALASVFLLAFSGIGLVAVLALFGFAGRYAVSHGRATLHAVHGKAEPARRGVLIINPGSGGGKATRFQPAGGSQEARSHARTPRARRRTPRISHEGSDGRRRCNRHGWG
jgi:hypothetical protein